MEREADFVTKQADVFAVQINGDVVVLRRDFVFTWRTLRKHDDRPTAVTERKQRAFYKLLPRPQLARQSILKGCLDQTTLQTCSSTETASSDTKSRSFKSSSTIPQPIPQPDFVNSSGFYCLV
jgi:shikimate kinase